MILLNLLNIKGVVFDIEVPIANGLFNRRHKHKNYKEWRKNLAYFVYCKKKKKESGDKALSLSGIWSNSTAQCW